MRENFSNSTPSVFQMCWSLHAWLYGSFAGAGVLFAVIFFGLGEDWLRSNGVTTHGVVERTYTTREQSDDGSNTVYWVEYYFRPNGDERLSTASRVRKSFYEDVREGSEVRVNYPPDNPNDSRLEGAGSRFAAVYFGLFCLLFVCVGCVSMWRQFAKARKAQTLQTLGSLERARIFEIKATGIKINRVKQYRPVWRLEDGTSGQGWIRSRTDLDKTGVQIGAEIEVYRLGDESLWVGDIGKRPQHLE